MFCKNCGKKLQSDGEYCEVCKTEIEVTTNAMLELSRNKTKKSKLATAFVILAFVLPVFLFTFGEVIYETLGWFSNFYVALLLIFSLGFIMLIFSIYALVIAKRHDIHSRRAIITFGIIGFIVGTKLVALFIITMIEFINT